MKLKEKLAKVHVDVVESKGFEIDLGFRGEFSWFDVQDAYLAGFEKAREMTVETCMTIYELGYATGDWATIEQFAEAIKLGDEEIDE